MTQDSRFPEGLEDTNKNKILELAKKIYGKEEKDLTRDEISFIVAADMNTIIKTLTVSAAATRPTEVKYATNNYYISTEIDFSGVSNVVSSYIENTEDGEMINKYLLYKSAVLALVKTKYEGMENYLRSTLDEVMKKDNCPVVGRNQ